MAMMRLQVIEEMHDAEDELVAAWDELTTRVCRSLEGWDEPADLLENAQGRVRLATGAVNAALDQALARVNV